MKYLYAALFALTLALPGLSYAEITPCSLTWAPNTESDLKGYRIYKSPTSGVYGPRLTEVGKVGVYDCSGTADDKTYFFRITAIDDAGSRTDGTQNPLGDNESVPSNEVSKLFKITSTVTLLPPPTNFKATGSTLSWDAVVGATAYALRVHEAGAPYDPCTSMVFCANVTGTSKTFTLKPGTAYDAWIHSINALGNGTSIGTSFTTPALVLPVYNLLAIVGPTTGMWGVEAIPTPLLLANERFDFYFDGALHHAEYETPYCSNQASLPTPHCAANPWAPGTHTIEVRFMRDNIEVSRKSLSANIADVSPPRTPVLTIQ